VEFLLKFTLISYASIVFFTMGLRLALLRQFDLSLLILPVLFILIAVSLSFSFIGEPFQDRLIISLVWTSVIAIGFRFGKKIRGS